VDQYVQNPIQVNTDELVRLYVINIGTTIPYQFHLHSTIFKAYPSGMLSNEPIDVQTAPVGPGDATLIEAKWKYPGIYMFHSHGFLEERGNMGQIEVVDGGDSNTTNHTNHTVADGESRSISMVDWQYELQKKLQNPKVVNYTDAQLTGTPTNNNKSSSNAIAHDDTTTFTHPTANASGAPIPGHSLRGDDDVSNNSSNNSDHVPTNLEISITQGSGNPNNEIFYDPSPVTVERGNSVKWINNDSLPHTATSGNPDNREIPAGSLFDTDILGPGQSSENIPISSDAGTYDYHCTLHPYMRGQLTIEE
jgi:nitrite reductase (NO-forming)